MKSINKIKSTLKYFVLAFTIVFASCETVDLDINQDPNSLTPDSADPSLILNSIQIQTVGQQLGLSNIVRGIMRHTNLFGTYANTSGAGVLNGAWATTYAITADKKIIAELNQTQALANHLGIAQVLEAFAYVNLVDYIGTAVYSEAVNPAIANPNLDSGQDIYEAMYAQLDDAIANLNATGQITYEDLFYAGDLTKWVKLANTLKIKMYVQTKLINDPNATAEINAIIASGNYITSADDDFVAQFDTNNDNPDARHPDFAATYDAGGAGGIYMSNEFMNILLNDKSIEDPRTKAYIYRQTLTDPTGNLLPCAGAGGFNFCYLGNGYWGRDHTDDAGIPNDGPFRATFGAYPAGGAFDTRTTLTQDVINPATAEYALFDDTDADPNNDTPINPATEAPFTLTEWIDAAITASNVRTQDSQNLGGAGIFPMITSSTVNFWLAEAALPAPAGLGITGSASTYLTNALGDSFNKVSTFTGQTLPDTVAYVTEVSNNFTSAASDAARLEIIVKELFVASWGNSIDSYNAYRRTGFPNLGGAVIANTDFPRNFLIPESEINSNDNPSLIQITRTDQVFWDTNPAGFIQ